MRHTPRFLLAILLTTLSTSCGSSSSPTSPGGSSPATNSNPVITAMTVTPAFAVSGLNTFTFTASATDADGDTVTYTWTVGSVTLTGASATATLTGDGSVTVRLTVTDTKSGSASDTRTVTLGTMTGTWRASLDRCPSSGNPNAATGFMTFTLTQTTAGVLSGTMITGSDWCSVTTGTTGQLDPAVVNSINAAAAVSMRIKVGAFIDFQFTGTMDSTGRRVVGPATGSGLDGATITFAKQ